MDSQSSRSCEQEKEKFTPVFLNFKQNYNYISRKFNHTEDLQKQILPVAKHKLSLIYLETMIDEQQLQEKIMTPIQQLQNTNNLLSALRKTTIGIQSLANLTQAMQALVEGAVLIFVDHASIMLSVNIKKSTLRSITEPTSEKIIKGAHDGFIEDIDTNINVIRNRLKNPNLTLRYYQTTSDSSKKSALLFLNNVAPPACIEKIDKRLKKVSTNQTAPSFIEELIQDFPLSPFPQILNTERPDRVVGNLLEGRAVVLEDQNPNALIMPVNFFSFYQSPDDYHSRWLVGSFFRFIRLLGFFITIFLPALYIAVIGFHFEVLPDPLLLPIKKSIQGIPYPPLVEALIMEIILELIREAGIRLPTTIGQTIGIVGGLVIGDAVVKAGLISNTMIVVVALTAIASFVVPSNEMSNSIRLIRFGFMLAAAIIGLPGIVFTFIILIIHLCQLDSFGCPYFYPIAPFHSSNLQDTLIRKPTFFQFLHSKEGKHEK
ncbi:MULTISPECIES: spore germination protein [Bacillus cereus group]|nr:spore germination protein [Bacillus thuringiensis]MCQ6336204.1 spore germination protein [Bacillus cereus]